MANVNVGARSRARDKAAVAEVAKAGTEQGAELIEDGTKKFLVSATVGGMTIKTRIE
jgi:hypothetical protein